MSQATGWDRGCDAQDVLPAAPPSDAPGPRSSRCRLREALEGHNPFVRQIVEPKAGIPERGNGFSLTWLALGCLPLASAWGAAKAEMASRHSRIAARRQAVTEVVWRSDYLVKRAFRTRSNSGIHRPSGAKVAWAATSGPRPIESRWSFLTITVRCWRLEPAALA